MSFVATALITGGSSGLGLSTARAIAKQRPDWRVLIASRNGLKAADRLNSELKKIDGRTTANVFYLPLDCSSQQAVRKFAQTYSDAGHPPIKALLINAGVQIVKGVQHSRDGYEMTFATNHLGQALLFFLLQPHLTNDAHIIITGSGLHRYRKGKKGKSEGGPVYISAEDCAHPDKHTYTTKSSISGQQRYALSKLVNILWLYVLRRRAQEQGKGWTVAGFEPGFMPGTGLARDSPPLLRFIWNHILPRLIFLIKKIIPRTYTPDQSGQILAKLAIQEGLVTNDDATAYWRLDGAVQPDDNALNVESQMNLWNWTLQAVAQDKAEKERFADLQP